MFTDSPRRQPDEKAEGDVEETQRTKFELKGAYRSGSGETQSQ